MTATTTDENALPENPLSVPITPLSLLRFAFPTMFMMVFYGLYTIVDTIFVSRFVNTNALSSINIVTPAINVIVGLGAMLAAGGTAIIGRKLGAGREAEARSDLTQLTLTGAVLGLAIAAVGTLYLDDIVAALGASDILHPYARDYLSILILFTPASMVQVLFSMFFIAAGRPGLGMVAGVLGGVVNAVFDYLFIVEFGMGISGAAIATGMGYMVPALTGLVFFFRNRQNALHFGAMRFSPAVLGESCYNGSSEMVSQLSAAVSTFFFNAVMLRLLAENGVAAITIMIYSQFLLTTLFIGFSMGVAPIISFNYGGGDRERLRSLRRLCYAIIAVMSVVIFAVVAVGSPFLLDLFSPRGTEVFAVSRNGFSFFQYSFLLCGINIFSSAFFTALSNGLVSAVISFSRTFVFIMLGLMLLPGVLGVNGVWLTVPMAELLSFILSFILLAANRKRYGY